MESGSLYTAPGLVISYVSQDTSFLKGSIFEFCREKDLDESLFCAAFGNLMWTETSSAKTWKNIRKAEEENPDRGRTPDAAHLYIWDEPLNFVDLFSRIQMEELLLEYGPPCCSWSTTRRSGSGCHRRVSLPERGWKKQTKI